MKSQASKAKPAHVRLHIQRQKRLGERMIHDHDRPRRVELAASLLMLAAAWLFK